MTRFGLFFLWFSILTLSAHGATFVDAKESLEESLQKLGPVLKGKLVNYTQRVCKGHYGGGGGLYSSSEGHYRETCRNEQRSRDERYSEPLKVVFVEPVFVSDLAYQDAEVRSLPSVPRFTGFDARNCSSSPQTTSTNLAVTVNVSSGISITNGITTSVAVSKPVNFSVPLGGTKSGVNLRFGRSATSTRAVSFSETKSSTVSDSIAYSERVSRTIPARTRLWGQFLVTESTIRVPFTATVIVDGQVDENLAGYKNISDLLPEEDRTFKITGFVEATGASESRTEFNDEQLSESECTDTSVTN